MIPTDFLVLSIIIGSWLFNLKNPDYTSFDLSRYKNLIPHTREFDANTEK